MVSELCRHHGCIRSGTYSRPVVTVLGNVTVNVQRMKIPGKGTLSSTLDALGIRRKRYSNDVRIMCSDLESDASYGRASKQFERITGIHVPKRTIHAFVEQIAPVLEEENMKAAESNSMEYAMVICTPLELDRFIAVSGYSLGGACDAR